MNNNAPFSQRYCYVKPDNVLIREDLSGAILNTVINSLSELYNKYGFSLDFFKDMNNSFARYYLNLRFEEMRKFRYYYIDFIDNPNTKWYERLDAIEWIIAYHRKQINESKKTSQFNKQNETALNTFIADLNREFERLNYAYRIINDIFVETTSNCELSTINEAMDSSECDIVTHLSECLKLMSPSNPQLSTRNAIKEAISAVELIARRVTNTNTLDNAFKKFNKLHPLIKNSMNSLYQYTNQPNTVIRHAWMSQNEEPAKDEAIFVLVTACAFINYLRKLYQR